MDMENSVVKAWGVAVAVRRAATGQIEGHLYFCNIVINYIFYLYTKRSNNQNTLFIHSRNSLEHPFKRFFLYSNMIALKLKTIN